MTLDEILEPYRQAMFQSAETPTLPVLGGPQPYRPDFEVGGFNLDPFSHTAARERMRYIGDALRANNNIFTSIVDWATMTNRLSDTQPDPTFNVFRDYDLKGFEQYAYQFSEARSREQADIIKDFIIRDMAARQSFSDQGPWTQFLLGTAASLGPADVLPFVALPKRAVGAGLALGGAMGTQSLLRHSMGTSPGDASDVALDASLGFLFGSGYRAVQRAITEHGVPFQRWKDAADEADAASAQPKPASPGGWEKPLVMDEPPEPPVTPKPAAHDAPFVIEEPGPVSGAMSDHRRQPIRDPDAAPDRPVILYEPVYLQEGEIVDLPNAPKIIAEETPSGDLSVEAGMYSRPWILSETDEAGNATARTAPSVHEIVTGQMGPEELSARNVKVTQAADGAPPPPDAEGPPRRPVIIEDSGVGAGSAVGTPTDEASKLASAAGLERFGLTPALRLLNSGLATMRETAAALVNHGMLQMGNLFGVAADQSVEARYHALHGARITNVVHGFWQDYAEHVGSTIDTGSRTVDFAATRVIHNKIGSYRDFMAEVSKAVLHGVHEDPAVVKAARRFFDATEDLRQRANEVGYWDFLYGMREEELIQRIRAEKKNPERKARMQHDLEELQKEREAAKQRGGPVAAEDEGYLPRYWRYDKIMAERGRVEAIFDEVIKAKGIKDPITGRPYTGKDAVDILLNIDPATGMPRPYVKPKAEAFAHSARDRGFSWMPTSLLLDYVETDAEVLFRRYVRQIGMDIELTERFGDPFMMSHIRRLAGEGASRAELEDLMFLRDYLRGTHVPMDPTSLLTHSVQAAKMLANMVVLGGQAVTALTDFARPFMTEGIRRAFGTSLRIYGDGLRGIRLWREEAELLGTTGELVQSLRAQAFANGSSALAGTPGWLQTLERAHSGFFILNGIAPWTEAMKTWQTIITATRIMDHVEELGRGEKLSTKAMQKLAAIGIDARNAGDIAEQLKKHSVWLGRTRLPNIQAWDNLEAARTFRTASWQAVNNSIITPGAANVSRWMVEGTDWLSPQAAQLLSMYHNYGLALHQRLLVAGLQNFDANFVASAMGLVALGFTVDHIRDQLNAVGDRQPRYKTFAQRLTDAVDRSGLPGYATNINNAIERLSFNTLGVRPFTGQVDWGGGTVASALGGLGPVGGWAGNLYRLVHGATDSKFGWAEAQAMRRMLPLQNVFWMDGLFDRLQDAAYFSPEERKEWAKIQRNIEAARIMRDNGFAGSPTRVFEQLPYIPDLVVKWQNGDRKLPLREFLAAEARKRGVE